MESLIKTQRSLVLKVNDVAFGIDISSVKEVFKTNKIFTLPRTSRIIAGIVNLRGSIITIFNMAEILFGSSERKKADLEEEDSTIILVNILNQDVGLQVDKIIQLTDIQESHKVDPKEVEQSKITLTSAITSVGITHDSSVYSLDIDKMLSDYLSEKSDSLLRREEEHFDDFNYEQYTLPEAPEKPEAIEIAETPESAVEEDDFD